MFLLSNRRRTPARPQRLQLEALEDRCLLTLAFAVQPQTSSTNARFAPIEVTSTLASSVTLSLGSNPGATQLGGTVTQPVVNGKATFTDLFVQGGQPAKSFTLIASAANEVPIASTPFDLKAGGHHLLINLPQSAGVAGQNLGPLTVQVLDINGTVTRDDDTTQIALTLDKNPGGARFVDASGNPLSGTLTAQVSNGVATFSDVRLDKAGIGYTLAAVATNGIDILPATSDRFQIVAGQAASLAFLSPPTFTIVNQPINVGGRVAPLGTPGVVVQVVDRWDNPVTNSTAQITMARSDGGQLGGLLQVTAQNGVAVFDSLVIGTAGTQMLRASSPNLTQRDSAAFTVSPATLPLKLTFVNPPAGPLKLGERLPDIQVKVLDGSNNPVANMQGVEVRLGPTGNILGNAIATLDANGEATFRNVYLQGRNLNPSDPNSLKIQLQAGWVSLPFITAQTNDIPLAPGQAVRLKFEDSQIDSGTAGEYLTAGGNPVRVLVQDAYGNTVTGNTSTIYLGVNRAAPNSDTTPIGSGNTAGDPSTLGTYVTAVAVNGVATFDKIYINRASTKYQLAVGTLDQALQTNTSLPFDLAVGAANKIQFLVQPDTVGSRQRMTGIGNQIMVSVSDRVGNVVTSDSTTSITMTLGQNPGGATLQSRTTVVANKGIGVFDLMYVDLANTMSIPGNTLIATAATLPNQTVESQVFTLNPPPGGINLPLPNFTAVTTPTNIGVNQPITVSYMVSANGQPANTYDPLSNVLLQLLDNNGNPANQFLVGQQYTKQPVQGLVTFSNDLRISTAGQYKLRALLDFGAKEIVSAVFNVGSSLLSASGGSVQTQTQTVDPKIQSLDLGSYTENFDYISSFDAYKFQADGSDQPNSQKFRPPSLGTSSDEIAPMLQPNVTTDFSQVAQSTKWWASMMFQRTKAVGIDERDSEGDRLFPMYPSPFATMVNGSSTFAGLGLTHLTHRYVIPAGDFIDNPRTQPDERGAGSVEYFFNYSGVQIPDQRLYQDISVGLKGVQADAKVKSYTDWTVTLDWNNQLQATLGEGIPFAYFQATNGGTLQVVTTNTNRTTTVTAFDASGNATTTGTGAMRLKISYTVQEKPYPTADTTIPITVENTYGVFFPSGVTWTLTNGNLEANLTTAKNYVSVGVLPDDTQATFDFYRQRAYSHVTGATANYSFNEATGQITTTFSLQTRVMESGGDLLDNRPLQSLYLNQWRNLQPGTPLTNYTYISPRGTMKVFDGPVFSTQLQHRGHLPLVPPIPEDGTSHATLWNDYLLPYLVSISSQSTFDGSLTLDQLIPNGQNNYLDFQTMLGATQLIPILEEISRSQDAALTDADRALALSSARKVFEIVKARMGAWLSATDDQQLQLFYYQPRQLNEADAPAGIGWQAMLSQKPGFLSSETLNDQHLIHGYFLKVAAILTQYDSEWGQMRTTTAGGQTTLAGKLGEIVNRVIRNVSNPDRGDVEFPHMRNFDAYQGHSWADGAANDPLGTNQESSSEAINYASGLIAWGEAIGDRAIRDLGVYLYNTEIESVNTYYFNVNQTDAFPSDFNPNPPPAADYRPNIAILYSASAALRGFVGLIPSNLAGIQLLPLTGGSLYLGRDTNFVQQNFDRATTATRQEGAIPVTPSGYLSVVDPYYAFVNGDQALTKYLTDLPGIGPINPGVPIDNAAFNVHWINVFQSYGQVDASVTADTVSYAVFIKTPGDASTRTFVAYNAGTLPRTVNFRDATGTVVFTLTVPARTTVTSNLTGTKVVSQTDSDFSQQTPSNRFFFSSATDGNGNHVLLPVRTGTGESSADIPAPGTTVSENPPAAAQRLTYKITGLTGTLKSDEAQAFFSLWVDPQFATSDNKTPYVRVLITYDPDGSGTNTVQHAYDGFSLSTNPGYVNGVSSQNGGVIGLSGVAGGAVFPYPRTLNNGTITIDLWAREGNANTIKLRTDAVGEQGRVSYIDLPYNFTQIEGQAISTLNLGTRPTVQTAVVAATGGETLQGSGTGHTYRATLSADGNTATFVGNAAADTLVFSAQGGLLRHNRFAAGDPGFASEFDFDTRQAGVQTLSALATSRVIVNPGLGADVVTLGTPQVPASALGARFTLVSADPRARLNIDDGARLSVGNYSVNGTSVTTTDGALDVRWSGRVFGRGVSLLTGRGTNSVEVLATRSAEPLFLDTARGLDVVTIGRGSVRNILGNVTVNNTHAFSDLIVDNSQASDFAAVVTISPTSIVGLAPGRILFPERALDDLEVYGGLNHGTYQITGAFPGAYLYLDAGRGNDTILCGNNGVMSDSAYAGLVILEGGPGANVMRVDNSRGSARVVAATTEGLDGLTTAGMELTRFDTVTVNLGPAADVLTTPAMQPGVAYVFNLGGGNDLAQVQATDAPLTVNGQAGNDTLAITGTADRFAFAVQLNGGLGNDQYQIAGLGNTVRVVDGGGLDTLDFGQATGGVNVNLGLYRGQSQAIGLGDTALSLIGVIDHVFGSDFADTLTGNTFANVLHGLGGSDVLSGLGGNDVLDGGMGNDVLRAGTGNNILLGGAGDDTLNAGPGRDVLIGGAGLDLLFGGVVGGAGAVLVGESTIHDANLQALRAVLAEWSAARTLGPRIRNLLNGTGSPGRRNGNVFLNANALVPDGVADVLFGDSRWDWFAGRVGDQVIDRNPNA